MPNVDPIAVFDSAAEEAKQRYTASVRYQRDKVILQPLVGEKATKTERKDAFGRMALDPAQVLGLQDELMERYNLDEGMIPKRLAEALERGFKEMEGD